MKKTIVAALLFLCITGAQAQNPTQNKAKADIYSPLKPKDASPYVFTTQAELDAKKESKKNTIIARIRQNENDAVKVQRLREQLWRIENAVVQTPSNK
jgi:hypothetical protein